ncbi:MAG: hypothetical protein HRF43_13830 [Phycisphaerae bacterium]|jgi:tetratricopeptide (TPR) repeat protein
MRIARPGRVNFRFLTLFVLVIALLAGGAAGGYKLRSRVIARRALEAGKAALDRRDWVEACKHLKQYLVRHPEDPEMLARYAEANLSLRPLEPEHLVAAAAAHRVLFRRMNVEASGRELTRLYMALGKYSEAAYICELRLERNPREQEARWVLAQTRQARGQYPEAINDLVALLGEGYQEPGAFVTLVECLQHQRGDAASSPARRLLPPAEGPDPDKRDLVEGLLTLGIEKNPDSALLLGRRARYDRLRAVAARRGPDAARSGEDLAAARADLEAADKLPTLDPATLFLLFEEWLEHGEPERSAACLARVDALDPAGLREQGYYAPEQLDLPKLQCAATLLLRTNQSAQAAALAERAAKTLRRRQWLQFLPLGVELYLLAGRPNDARRTLEDGRALLKESSLAENDAIRDRLVLLDAQIAVFESEPYVVIGLLEPLLIRSPGEVSAALLLARAYLQTGQLARALRICRDLRPRSLGPDQEAAAREVLTAAIRACADHGRPEDAIQLLQSLGHLGPATVATELLALRLEIGTTHDKPAPPERIGEWSARLAKLADAAPRSGEVRVLQAGLALRQDHVDEALGTLETAFRECDDTLSAGLNLALLYAGRKKDLPQAIDACSRTVQKHPDQASARAMLAAMQNAAGLKEQARATLEQAVRDLAGPERHKAIIAFAGFLAETGEAEQVAALLEQAAADWPRDPAVRMLLLGLPRKQSDPAARKKLVDELRTIEGERGLRWRLEQAKALLHRVGDDIRASRTEAAQAEPQVRDLLRFCTQADPQWSEPVAVLGELYGYLGKRDLAEQEYRHLLDANPADLAIMDRLLVLLRSQGRFIEADDLLKRVPKDRLSASTRLMGHQAGVSLALGNVAAAATTIEQMISARPKDATLRILLAKALLVQRGDLDRALGLLDEADRLSPGLFETFSTRVTILHARGRDRQAADLLDRQVEQKKDYQSILLRAQFRTTLRSFDLAEEDFVRLSQLDEYVPRGHEVLGRFYLSRNDADKAFATWEAGLKAAPGDERLRHLLVRMLLQRAEPRYRQHGLALLDESLQRTPNDPDYLSMRVLYGPEPADEKARARVMAMLEQMVRDDPHHLRAHLNLIELEARRGRPDDVRTRINAALGANPRNGLLLQLAAEIEQALGNLARATAYAQAALEGDPSDLPARQRLVRLALASGDARTADARNREILLLAPHDEQARLTEAGLLKNQGRLAEAIQRLEDFRTTDEGRRSLNALLMLAELYRTEKDYVQAQARIDAARQRSPESLGVLREQVALLAEQDRFDELLTIVQERAQAGAGAAGDLHAAASVLVSSGKDRALREALGLYERIAQAAPDNAALQIDLAETAYRLGEYQRAAAGYEAARRLRPRNLVVLNGLAWTIGVILEKPAEGLAFAEQGLALQPGNVHLLDTRGFLLFKLGRLEEARADLEKCLASPMLTAATRVSALRHLAEVHVRLGEPARAKEKLTEALRYDVEKKLLSDGERAEMQALLASFP